MPRFAGMRLKSGAPVSEPAVDAKSDKRDGKIDGTLQREVVRLRRQLDKGIEAKDLAERFVDREKELKLELAKLKSAYQKTSDELSNTKYLVKNKHDMTTKCKLQVKALELKCADYDTIKEKLTELQKSVLQDSVVADLTKKYNAQLLRAKRAHVLSRDNAARLAGALDAEQLRSRSTVAYEDDFLFAYRSLRAEYNRDVGRAPSVVRPRRQQQQDGDWLDGESDGEPVGLAE